VLPEPRVTVLIPVWNNAATLRRAIDSILAQTMADLELIVLDDGSTDETPSVVRSIQDPRLRYLALPHRGISASLNRGLDEARAPLVAVQDADDWSLPTRLERQLAAFDAEPAVAVVGCLMREVDERGRELRPRQPRVAGDVTALLPRFNPTPNTSSVFRRDLAVAAGGFEPEIRYAQDYALWSRLADEHRIVNVGEILAVRQMGAANAGARQERVQLLESLRIRLAMMRRRRTLRGLVHLLRPTASLLTPLPLKRLIRRRRGVAA
jgi:glycosyltransferase involved in cell wall biosynthesis